MFPLLNERPEVFSEWKRLVALHAVSGLKVYDTRLVASAVAHGMEALLRCTMLLSNAGASSDIAERETAAGIGQQAQNAEDPVEHLGNWGMLRLSPN